MHELGKIPAKKSLGQHFLNNAGVPKRMADAAGVSEEDIVLEIGPGTGVLTRELLARGAKVTAIEADMRAVHSLEQDFAAFLETKQLTLIHADIRTYALQNLGLKEHAYKVVANIPYFLSGKLFRMFLETNLQPSTIVFLVQKEVAERIARDKKESILSLSVKLFGTPTYIHTVKPGNFTPPPAVDSAILCIDHISHERLQNLDKGTFFRILHHGFASKRKQLLGNLSKIIDRDTLTHLFSTLGLPLNVRGEDLNTEMWLTLVRGIVSTEKEQFMQ